MASLSRRLLLQSRQCPARIQYRVSPTNIRQWQQALSTTAKLYEEENIKDRLATAATAKPTVKQSREAEQNESENSTIDEAKSSYRNMSPEERTAAQLAKLVSELEAMDPEAADEAVRKGERGIPFAQHFNLEEPEHFRIEKDDKNQRTNGFWAEGEESMGPDEDYYGDDITSHGHGQLAQHRELREYARLIAWELPLLNQLAKPFQPPTAKTPFRFRYTSYMGESHPAANKVVVEFSPHDLTLTSIQRDKLIKLAGPRYNPSSKIVKMACEKFDTQAQNKRFLGETIHSLIQEAKDSKDTFEDVPFDFRHHKPKPKHYFPTEWVLTKERKAYLEAKRAEQAKLEDERLHNGKLIDGKTIIDTSLPFLSEAQAQAETVMVGGPRGRPLR